MSLLLRVTAAISRLTSLVVGPHTNRTGTSRVTVLFVVSAILISCMGLYIGSELSQSAHTLSISARTSPLQVDSKHLDFGEVLARSNFEMRLPISNVLDQDIEITEWVRSCGTCTTVEPATLTIPAGQTREVFVTLDLTQSRPAEALNQSREFSKSIIPRVRFVPSGDEYTGPPMEWSLVGNVKDFIAADPPVVLGGERSVRDSAFSPFSINLTYGMDVEAVTAACPPSRGTVAAVRIDSRHWRLDMTPAAESDPTVGEFRYKGALNIK